MIRRNNTIQIGVKYNLTQWYRFVFIIFFVGGVTVLQAQNKEKNDSTNLESDKFYEPILNYAEKTVFQYLDKTSTQKSRKAFNFSVIGGPYYTDETKIGMGIIGSGLFRLRGCENDSLPSNVSLYTNVTTSGAYAVGIQSTIYFKDMQSWIYANVSFSDTPSQYWGTGYYDGRNSKYTEYNLQQVQLKIDYKRKMAKYLSGGVAFSARDMRGKYFDDISILRGEKRKITAMGLGLNLSYDSRDVVTDPYKGIYAHIDNMYYPNYLGNTATINRVDLIFRYYKELRKGTVVAFDFDANLNFGNVPWIMMSLAGGANQMRGYYTGRYRDKKLIDTQVELRQHIYKRSGMAIWFGGGNVFSKFDDFKIKQFLPTYGLGYRFRLKPRTNLRLDYGFGKGQSAFYININEAF